MNRSTPFLLTCLLSLTGCDDRENYSTSHAAMPHLRLLLLLGLCFLGNLFRQLVDSGNY